MDGDQINFFFKYLTNVSIISLLGGIRDDELLKKLSWQRVLESMTLISTFLLQTSLHDTKQDLAKNSND